MWPNPQETTDFVTFTEEMPNRKLHLLCSELHAKVALQGWMILSIQSSISHTGFKLGGQPPFRSVPGLLKMGQIKREF